VVSVYGGGEGGGGSDGAGVEGGGGGGANSVGRDGDGGGGGGGVEGGGGGGVCRGGGCDSNGGGGAGWDPGRDRPTTPAAQWRGPSSRGNGGRDDGLNGCLTLQGGERTQTAPDVAVGRAEAARAQRSFRWLAEFRCAVPAATEARQEQWQ